MSVVAVIVVMVRNISLRKPCWIADMSLVKIIESQDQEIRTLKTAVKCRDEQIDILESCSLSVNHDAFVTSYGAKWHLSRHCSHVQGAAAFKTLGACKHCVQTKPK